MYLFIDCETSGLLLDDVPLGDDAQPWIVQVAWAHVDAMERPLSRASLLIKAEGRKIKPGAEDVHGISAKLCEQNGFFERHMLAQLAQAAGMSQAIISYGDFDARVVESLLYRLERRNNLRRGAFRDRWRRPGLEFVNVMAPAAQQACKLPSKVDWSTEYAWPKLDTAAEIILGIKREGVIHDAWEDLTLLKRLYFELKRRGHFDGVAA